MASPVLSIIVPVYKVEKYLPRCLDSIWAQTFKDYECILVDDGSPDNCGEICDEYAQKDSRFKVIHQKNGGLSAARNAAMAIAQGEYVAFVDSDDYILPLYAETMLKLMKEHQADIVKCDYMNGKLCEETSEQIIKVYTGEEFTTKILTDEISSQLWQYIAKRELWNGIESPVDRLAEDMMIFFRVTGRAHKVVSTSKKLYFYFVDRENNISNSSAKKIKNALDRAIAFKIRFVYAKEHKYENVTEDIIRRVIEFYNIALTLMPVKEHKYDADICELSDFLIKHKEEWRYKKQGIKLYIVGNCIAYFPRVYCALKWFWPAGRGCYENVG